jgi:hypothetical protein
MALAGLKKLITANPKRLGLEAYAAARPVQNPLVETFAFEDGARLRAPLQSQGTGLMGLMAKWAKLPDTKEFELEAVGSFVWQLCDGEHTTEAIARELRGRFKMNRLEADASLAAFLEMLANRRLITMLVPAGRKGGKGRG